MCLFPQKGAGKTGLRRNYMEGNLITSKLNLCIDDFANAHECTGCALASKVQTPARRRALSFLRPMLDLRGMLSGDCRDLKAREAKVSEITVGEVR
jgi:hypothetical protein